MFLFLFQGEAGIITEKDLLKLQPKLKGDRGDRGPPGLPGPVGAKGDKVVSVI